MTKRMRRKALLLALLAGTVATFNLLYAESQKKSRHYPAKLEDEEEGIDVPGGQMRWVEKAFFLEDAEEEGSIQEISRLNEIQAIKARQETSEKSPLSEDIGFIKAPSKDAVASPSRLLLPSLTARKKQSVDDQGQKKKQRESKFLSGSFSSVSAELPVQQNPWVDKDGDAKADPFEGEDFDLLERQGCQYRQFRNHSVYSRPEFIDEYVGFRRCVKGNERDSLDEWTEAKIQAETGKKGELRLKSNFRFELEVERGSLCPVDKPPLVLYIVFSSSSSFGKRETIRKTWGGQDELSSKGGEEEGHKLIFFVGSNKTISLTDEAMTHGDIVRSEVPEDDSLFEHKQMVAMLGWVYSRCELARFVVRTSDETFVNVRRVDMFRKQEMYAANRIYGTMLRRMEPNRDAGSSHYVSEDLWPWNYFPPFVAGPSYIVSGDVIPRLLVAARFTPVLPLGQVYFTGLASLTNRIMRIGVAEFFHGEVPRDEDECSYAKHGAIEGVKSYEAMRAIWARVSEVQETKKVTCTIKPACLAKVDGKCMIFAPKAKKKKKASSSGRLKP